MSNFKQNVTFRKVSIDDAERLIEIYRPYVEDYAVSFETTVPTTEEMKNMISSVSSVYPFIVALDENGEIIGYTYANEMKGREAYNWSVEVTVYVDINQHRVGIGRRLYTKLEKSLRNMGILNTYACVVTIEAESDPYLTMESFDFHERMGYHTIGTFHKIGYKFNRWYDMVWMGKMLGKHSDTLEDVKFGEWDLVDDWV